MHHFLHMCALRGGILLNLGPRGEHQVNYTCCASFTCCVSFPWQEGVSPTPPTSEQLWVFFFFFSNPVYRYLISCRKLINLLVGKVTFFKSDKNYKTSIFGIGSVQKRRCIKVVHFTINYFWAELNNCVLTHSLRTRLLTSFDTFVQLQWKEQCEPKGKWRHLHTHSLTYSRFFHWTCCLMCPHISWTNVKIIFIIHFYYHFMFIYSFLFKFGITF